MSETIFNLAQISKNRYQITVLSIFSLMDSAKDSDLAHLYGDLKNFQRLSHLWVSFRSKMTVRTTKLFWLFAFSVRVRFPELAQSDHDVTDAGFGAVHKLCRLKIGDF